MVNIQVYCHGNPKSPSYETTFPGLKITSVFSLVQVDFTLFFRRLMRKTLNNADFLPRSEIQNTVPLRQLCELECWKFYATQLVSPSNQTLFPSIEA